MGIRRRQRGRGQASRAVLRPELLARERPDHPQPAHGHHFDRRQGRKSVSRERVEAGRSVTGFGKSKVATVKKAWGSKQEVPGAASALIMQGSIVVTVNNKAQPENLTVRRSPIHP